MGETISIVLCGDTLPARPLVNSPASAREIFALAAVADLSIGNFEIPLTDRGAPVQKLLNIRAEPAIAADLASIGLDVVTLANNHAVDYGWIGLADTKDALCRAGLTVVGVGETLVEASRPAFQTVGSTRIGIIAFSCLTPTGMGAAENRPGVSPLHIETAYEIDPWYQMEEPGDPSVVKIRTRVRQADSERAVQLISETRKVCDLLIVTLHWGFGSGEDLAEYQRPLAHALIEAGADVIHGHHPHAVHAFGFHRGKPIIYSAGTYIGQQTFLPASLQVLQLWAGMSPDGFVTTLTYDAEKLVTIQLAPTTLDADRLPRSTTGTEFQAILARLQRLSADHGAELMADGSTIVVRPAA